MFFLIFLFAPVLHGDKKQPMGSVNNVQNGFKSDVKNVR